MQVIEPGAHGQPLTEGWQRVRYLTTVWVDEHGKVSVSGIGFGREDNAGDVIWVRGGAHLDEGAVDLGFLGRAHLLRKRKR